MKRLFFLFLFFISTPAFAYKVTASVGYGMDQVGIQNVSTDINLPPTANGNVIQYSSALSAWIVGAQSGSASVPTGTGFYHVNSGNADAAARAVNLASADITGVLAHANGGNDLSTNPNNGFFPIGNAGTYTMGHIVSGSNVTVTETAGGISIAATSGGSTPTGTGFTHINNGNQDAAARAVNIASSDITGVLPIANGGTNQSTLTSTGFYHVNNGAFDTASRAVNLASSDVTGTLAVGNGGTGVATGFNHGFLPIGNGTGFTMASIVSGANVTVTNTAGQISIASSGGSGYATIQNAGSSVTQRATANLSGNFVHAVDNSASTRTDIIDNGAPLVLGAVFTAASGNRYSAPYTSVIDATEANMRIWKIPYPCTAKNLNFAFNTAAGAGKQQRGTIWKNGVSTNVTCVAADPTTSCSTVSQSVAFVSNDTVTFENERGGAATAAGNMAWSFECDG